MQLLQDLDKNRLSWFNRTYLADWAAVAVLWILAAFAEYIPPYEREFSHKDSIIDHEHHTSQVKSTFNDVVTVLVPSIVVLTYSVYNRSMMCAHHGLVSLFSAKGLSDLITEVLKNLVGRLRPDFLARCKWDKDQKICTGKLDKILDGRRSFPSGHSSSAFVGMMFLSLWIAGQTGCWCPSTLSTSTSPGSVSHLRHSRLLRFLLSLAPLSWATYVALTRLQDYRHHKEDVMVGSFIGIGCAVVCYSMFWPSPFRLVTFEASDAEAPREPRVLYTENVGGDSNLFSAERYELGRLDDPEAYPRHA